MNKMDIINKIEKNKSQLKNLGVKRIGLFGSFVKNKEHKKSDIDILVAFNSIEFDNYMDTFSLLEKLFKRKIDLVIEKNLIPELNYIKKEAEYVKL